MTLRLLEDFNHASSGRSCFITGRGNQGKPVLSTGVETDTGTLVMGMVAAQEIATLIGFFSPEKVQDLLIQLEESKERVRHLQMKIQNVQYLLDNPVTKLQPATKAGGYELPELPHRLRISIEGLD